MEKVITYTVVDYGGGPDLICQHIDGAIESLKGELEAADIDADNEPLEFIIRVEKKYTQEQINNLPEWR